MKFSHGDKPYVIAEIGSNHNGDMDLARKLIDAAKETGCDCAKFQSWDRDLFADEVYERNAFLDDGRELDGNLEELVLKFAVSKDDMAELNAHCKKVGIDFSSSVFTLPQLAEVAALEPSFIKIASMDLNNDFMISAAAGTGLPILLSTGLSSLEEIAHAVETVEATGNKDLVILHCLAMYPPPDKDVNLLNMDMLRDTFGYPVGFSDHTMGTEIGIACMARGAVAYEKHFTLDKELEGWDHATSADPEDMKLLTSAATRVHAAMGGPVRRLTDGEIDMRKAFRRSIVAARDISAGEILQMEDLDYKRPGVGLSPNTNASLVGRKAAHDIAKDKLISFTDLEGGPDQ